MMLVITELLLLAVAAHNAFAGRLSIQGSCFVKDGQKVFLSGANTAWVSYGYDFGNGQYQQRRQQFIHKLDMVKNAGGNSMRTWVHVHGATSPKFDSSGHVTGLDNSGTFLTEFKQYLDDAAERKILIFPTLWNGAVVQNEEYLRGLITDTSKLQSYLDKALIPWVRAVKSHPALGGWDIINEFEGFIDPSIHDTEPCFDSTFLENSGAGWAGRKYKARDLLRFVNWQVAAIRSEDSQAQVTAGSWSQRDQSGQFGDRNLYSNDCLVKAGGKSNGVLTFYSTHSYAWQGNFGSDAVFTHSYADYKLDKPLVVAEFQEKDNSGAGKTDAQLFDYVCGHGYAGAWVWSDDTESAQSSGISALKGRTCDCGRIPVTLS